MTKRIEEIRKSMIEAGFYSLWDIGEICRLEAEYDAECEKIADQCAEEGYPFHGSNYELRCENARRYYDEQIALIDSEAKRRNNMTVLEKLQELVEGTWDNVAEMLESCEMILPGEVFFTEPEDVPFSSAEVVHMYNHNDGYEDEFEEESFGLEFVRTDEEKAILTDVWKD